MVDKYLKYSTSCIIIADVFLRMHSLVYSCFGVFMLSASTLGTTSSPSIYDKYNYDFTQPEQDWVFLLDRHVGEEMYTDYVMSIVRDLLGWGVYIHPNYTRVAAISFAADWKIEFDHIDGGDPLYPCELLGTGGLMDKMHYVPNKQNHTGVSFVGAITKGRSILMKGKNKRPNSKSIIWLVTNGAELTFNDKIW